MITDAWFSPEAIRFTIPQIKFLLRHYSIIIEGRWPQGPADYVKPPNPKGRYYRPNAYFTRPCEVLAELDMRLERVSLIARAGLAKVYCLGYTYKEAAHQLGIPNSTLFDQCQKALEIMSQPDVLVENPVIKV